MASRADKTGTGAAHRTGVSLGRKITIGFAVVIATLCLVGAVSYHSIYQFVVSDTWDDQSREVLTVIADVFADVAQAESGERGYLITADETYLRVYDQAVARAGGALEELRHLTADNPQQQSRLGAASGLFARRREMMQNVIDARKAGGVEAAQRLILQGEGQRMMNQLREVIAAMRAEETVLLAQQTEASRASAGRAIGVIIAGSALVIALMAAAALVIARDMKARARAEGTLRDSEERYRFLADMLPSIVWAARADGGVNYYNARWEQYTGTSLAQSGEWGWKPILHPDDLQTCIERWQNSLASGEPLEGEYRFRRAADGEYRWHMVRGLPRRDDAGDIVQWVGTCVDIDDRKRADAEVRRARENAELANRAKSEFLANMSHEIRTPMNAILGYTDLMLDPDQSVSDRLNSVNIVRRNGEHLLTIINNILDISKIEAGEVHAERIECSPCQMICDIASTMRVRASEKRLQYQVQVEGPIPRTIHTDPTRLRQILMNLVGNAIKFTESGWVRTIVKLIDPPDSENPRLQFAVMDSGIGMTSEQLSRIFQPFSQGDASMTRRFGGSGLGLTISRHLARLLGGEIEVDTVPGQGSRFTLTIQTGALAGVEMVTRCAEAIVPPGPSEKDALPQLRGRVLLAEDGIDNQQLLSFYLRKAGADVTVAENGRIACEKILAALETPGAAGFDLVFMDMQMPELDGYAATARVRSKGFKGPIVALTAHAMADDRAKCINCGCTDYLTKPLSRAKLVQTAAQYLKAADVAVASAPIKSEIDDDSISPFLASYVSHLPKEVHQLSVLLEEQNLTDLSAVVHRLKGSGGLYGFMPITEQAMRAEALMKNAAAIDAIAAEVAQLVSLIRSIDGYDVALEKKLFAKLPG